MNCSNSNSTLLTLSIVRGTTAIFCAAVSLSTVTIIVYFRLFTTVLQRLYFYFSASTLAYLGTLFLMSLFTDEAEHKACTAVGFLGQWASITEVFFTFGVTAYLHVAFFRGHCRQLLELKWRTRFGLECLYIVFCIFSPPTVDWIPFTRNLYGRSGAWCWIVSLDRDCKDVGFVYQLTLQYLPILVLTLMTVSVLASAYLLLCCAARRSQYDNVSRLQRDRAKEMLVLLASVSVSSFLIIPEVITQVLFFKGHKPSFGVRTLYAIGTPLGKLGLSAALLFYLYSLRMFTWERVIHAGRAWISICRVKNGQISEVLYDTTGDTVSLSYGSTDKT